MTIETVPGRARRAGILPCLVVLGAAACGSEGSVDRSAESGMVPDPSRPVVAVSVLPLAGIVDRLLPADSARIEVLVPPGASPHSFEPGAQALSVVQRADLVLELGHPAFVWERGWLDGLLAGTDVVRLRVAEGCRWIPDDPHVWLDPECLALSAERTASVLAELAPGRKREIDSGLENFRRDLADADDAIRTLLAGSQGRAFLVQHPAWGYFARAYGLEQIAILTHDSGDAGAARLAEVIDRTRDAGIGTVFVQPQVSRDAASAIARETGAVIRVLDPLGRDPVQTLRETAAAVAEATAP